MAAKKDVTDSDDVVGLFRLPLVEFTPARNALATKLKKAGRADAAAQVKALHKPSISAWAINQLYWRHERDVAKLLEAGDRFREAQKAQLAGRKADVRGTLETRRQLLTSMTARAAEILKDAGHATTPDLMRRVATTLETLATYGSASPDGNGLVIGRLMDDIEPAGFEALATLIPTTGSRDGGGTRPRVIPFKHKERPRKAPKPKSAEEEKRQRDAEEAAKREEARKAFKAAEDTLRDARRSAREAEAALKKAAPRAKAAERLRAKAEKKFEELSRQADEMTKEARRVARAAEEAAQALTDAEAALAKAKETLTSG